MSSLGAPSFGAIVESFNNRIITPIVGFLTGEIDFKQKVINLGDMPVTNGKEIEAAVAAKQPLIMYGQFVNDVITILIAAIVNVFSGALRRSGYLTL